MGTAKIFGILPGKLPKNNEIWGRETTLKIFSLSMKHSISIISSFTTHLIDI